MYTKTRLFFMVLIGFALFGAQANGLTAVIVDQSSGQTVTHIGSQAYPDRPTYTELAFDDFTIGTAVNITTLTVFGREWYGNPSSNLNVVAGIYASPDLNTTPILSVSGTQVGGDLFFDFGGATLEAGSYWLGAYVVRPLSLGFWHWNLRLPVSGSQAMWHNPGGGFGLGTSPLPLGDVLEQADLAFILEGNPLAPNPPTATPVANISPIVNELTINGGALTTTALSTTLSVSASDLDGSQADLQMSFSNNGLDWSTWQPYTTTASWQLMSGDGVKMVYARVKDVADNLSAVVSDTIMLDTSVQSEYGVTINEAALYTNQVTVSLTISAKAGTTAMQVSNDGAFNEAQWEPYASRKSWQISSFHNHIIPRSVYVRYRDSNGSVSAIYLDDIILDAIPPNGQVQIMPNTNGTWLSLQAADDVSGVASMRLSNHRDFVGMSWEPFVTTRVWDFGARATVYVQFRDNAGNVSETYIARLTGKNLVFLPCIHN